jgi:hypothetical protein
MLPSCHGNFVIISRKNNPNPFARLAFVPFLTNYLAYCSVADPVCLSPYLYPKMFSSQIRIRLFSSRIRFPEQVLIGAKFHKDKKSKDSEDKVRKSPPKMCRIRDPRTGINSSRIRIQGVKSPDPGSPTLANNTSRVGAWPASKFLPGTGGIPVFFLLYLSLFSVCFGSFCFVSVQPKHRNVLFRY